MPFFSPFSRSEYVIAGTLAAMLDHVNEGHALRLMERKAGWSLGA